MKSVFDGSRVLPVSFAYSCLMCSNMGACGLPMTNGSRPAAVAIARTMAPAPGISSCTPLSVVFTGFVGSSLVATKWHFGSARRHAVARSILAYVTCSSNLNFHYEYFADLVNRLYCMSKKQGTECNRAHPTSTQPIGGTLVVYSETQSCIQSAREPWRTVISRPIPVCLIPTASSSDTIPRFPII